MAKSPPFDPRSLLSGLMAQAQTCGPEALAKLGASASLGVEQHVAILMRKAPPPAPIACAPGCSWCCHVLVLVTVAEVARIVRHLRATLTPDDYAALQRRCEEIATARRAVPIARWGRQRVACPLLVDARCSVH